MNDKDEWSELIQDIKDNVRNHAGYFAWEGNSAIEESGAIQCLFESLEYKNESFFHSIKSRENDPPDCEAINTHGDTIGIEVTELVDGDSIAKEGKINQYCGHLGA